MATTQIGHIKPFEIESDDWELYIECLDQFMLTNGIGDEIRKVMIFITIIGQKMYALLQNLMAPTKLHEKKYNELVESMNNHLKPRPLTIAERFKFSNTKENHHVVSS